MGFILTFTTDYPPNPPSLALFSAREAKNCLLKRAVHAGRKSTRVRRAHFSVKGNGSKGKE